MAYPDHSTLPRWWPGSARLFAYISLGILTLIYISSFLDRQIVAVLGTQIRDALALNNFQIGILYGPAFSFIYALFGLFMGRLADRVHRTRLIIAGLTIWSLMTALSGLATSIWFLLAARFMVGVSQAALSPAVYSLLADYFPASKRGTVYSIYASGIFIGVGASFLIGGSIAQQYDWRTALQSVGWPGIGLAVIAALVLREPIRNALGKQSQSTSKDASKNQPLSLRDTLGYLAAKPTFWYYLIGFSALAFWGYTILAFIGNVFADVHQSPDYIPYYGWFMLATGVSVNIAGRLADYLAAKFGPRTRFLIGIIAGLGGLPFYALGFLSDNIGTAFWLIGLGNVISSCYNGVAAALVQYLVPDGMRAFAGSIYLFVISIVGFGIGPPVTGWLIDHSFSGPTSTTQVLLSLYILMGIISSVSMTMAMRHYTNDAL
ncbi:MAG: spinster family MFS transporter [Bacteroidota bacterium]